MGLLGGLPQPASAQLYPTHPVRLVVPFPAGGPTDILARLVARQMSAHLHEQFVIDNRPGAGANIGAEQVARAMPDGYTLLMTTGAITVAPAMYPALGYDVTRDLRAISLVATVPLILVVNPRVPADNVAALIALARAQPGRLSFATTGSGTPIHLAAELFKSLTHLDLLHVPYKGSAPALIDLTSGQVTMMFDASLSVSPYVRDGRLRGLAVTGAHRAAVFPELPTLREAAGLPDYEASVWYGLFAPAGTEAAIIDRLHGAVVETLATADVGARLSDLGAEPVGSSPRDFAAFVAAEIPKWAAVVKASGAKLD
ncbi:MAG: tripartite tricarboxylate transporter substrate binding protein [Pseudomonadota bacterium]